MGILSTWLVELNQKYWKAIDDIKAEAENRQAKETTKHPLRIELYSY